MDRSTSSHLPRPSWRHALTRLSLPLALRIALRDFRGGLRGFGIFLACIALGVAAIVGVSSLSSTLKDGLARQGRTILGGDVTFNLFSRTLEPAEKDFLEGQGRLATVALMRAMARSEAGEAALVELKAVNGTYPLAGEVRLDPTMALADALAERDGVYGLVADAGLFERLNLKTGARVMIGAAHFELRATLIDEPDRLASGIGFGPRVFITQEALRATSLLQPGAIVRWANRVALKGEPASDEEVAAFVDKAKTRFPEAGWEIRTRENISPLFSRNLERFTEFLTLIGLTSLIVGGVGVANAVTGFVERKRPTIAILKSLGASGPRVFGLMLTQTLLVASAGIVAGALIGSALPFLITASFGGLFPFPLAPGLYPVAIAKGVLYGYLIALAFSAGPLGRVHDMPVQALFRGAIESSTRSVRPRYRILTFAATVCILASVLGFAKDPMLALIYMAATVAAYFLLRAAAFLIVLGARKAPHAKNVALRLAIGNIHRPGALTPSVVLSLGLGLALLVALTLIEANIRAELDPVTTHAIPSFFFVDVQNADAERFASFLKRRAPDADIELVPMLRGRIVRLNDQPVEAVHAKPNAAWVLEGDRGITFSDFVPQGSEVTSGDWWPKDYQGPPLVSIDGEIADGLGLSIGDTVTVNVLGRELTAKLANRRKLNWGRLGINFVLVFSPNSLAGAPYTNLATLSTEGGLNPAREAALVRETAREFPAVSIIRVKEALDAASALAGQLALAVRGAASVAILAAI
ncbi:MAG TPA: FtsX-like permease family protein, partial [Methylocella sp.]|nr:FtsX-like permease family protein [Methylocella sp.]